MGAYRAALDDDAARAASYALHCGGQVSRPALHMMSDRKGSESSVDQRRWCPMRCGLYVQIAITGHRKDSKHELALYRE